MKPFSFDATRLPSPQLTPSHEASRWTVRAYDDREVGPHVNAWDEEGKVPRELYRRAAAAGLLALGYPEEYGGVREGVDIFHALVASEELARAGSGGLSAGLMTHSIGLPPVLALGSDALKY